MTGTEQYPYVSLKTVYWGPHEVVYQLFSIFEMKYKGREQFIFMEVLLFSPINIFCGLCKWKMMVDGKQWMRSVYGCFPSSHCLRHKSPYVNGMHRWQDTSSLAQPLEALPCHNLLSLWCSSTAAKWAKSPPGWPMLLMKLSIMAIVCPET